MKRFWTFSKSVRQIAVIALTFVWLPCSVLAAESYYVAKNGADTNPGTLQQPWLTIQHAANVATPGSTVYVRAGTYQERVNINVSGNSQDGYITFCNYAGETPILDGSSLVAPTSDNGLFFVRDQNYIIIQGFQLQNYGTARAAVFPMGIMVEGLAVIFNYSTTSSTIFTPPPKQKVEERRALRPMEHRLPLRSIM